jgi:hypothetical protein
LLHRICEEEGVVVSFDPKVKTDVLFLSVASLVGFTMPLMPRRRFFGSYFAQ